jgi:hypothetical protein
MSDEITKNVESFFNSAEEFSGEDFPAEIEPFEKDSLLENLSLQDTVSDVDVVDYTLGTFDKSIDPNNPFYETFNAKSIVNRGETTDFIVEDLQKVRYEQAEAEKRNRNESYYVSKQELEHILNENPGIKFYKKDSEGNVEKVSESDTIDFENLKLFANDLEGLSGDELIEIAIPVGKKIVSTPQPTTESDTEQKEETPESKPQYDGNDDLYDGDNDDDVYYLSEEDLEKKRQKEELRERLKGIQDAIDAMNAKNAYKNPNEVFSEFLQDNFKDYLLAKKITGNNHTRFSDKIIDKEIIEDSHKSVEITDFAHSHNISNKTSILINRDDNMEIESIEIICKCGERTAIRFDEVENFATTKIEDLDTSIEDPANTKIIIDSLAVTPMDYLAENQKLKEEYKEFVAEEINELLADSSLEEDDETVEDDEEDDEI